MGNRLKELTADLPHGSRALVAFGAFIGLTFCVSAMVALAMATNAFVAR